MPELRPHDPDDELGQDLTRLGTRLDYPEPMDLAARVARTLRAGGPPPSRRRWDVLEWPKRIASSRRPTWQPIAVAAALVLALFAGSLLAFPSVRETIADWLGVRGIGITVVPSLSPVPTNYRSLIIGRPVSLEEARTAVAWPVLMPDDALLGPPDEVYLDLAHRDGAVSLVWGARPGLPVASTTGAGLLLTEFRGSINEQFFQKFVGPGSTVERVHVGDRIGFWISGAPHEVVVLDRSGKPIFDTIRLAGNVLMWEEGELTLRMESELGKDDALRVAASVH
jgi:hypothetical protein